MCLKATAHKTAATPATEKLWGGKNNEQHKYSDIINQALNSYRSCENMEINETETQNFCNYMLAQIF